ncbi:selenide, water dikinase SelD [Vibrio sp. WXL210]|uniref:selenide, water dikinase SelD n=1 Tax=Vibrio sp. WXL210 TaxID=3450709 RepID=UPI003EC61BC1
MMEKVRLTEYSPGGGCGCKLSPQVLQQILKTNQVSFLDPNLLVGNETKDDAAVYDLQNGTSVVSTTDFFTPIVDDAFDFGRVAATNAISDIYAMGGKPIMAIAILGWPTASLPPSLAAKVIEGARSVCSDAGITLAGGHSIDISEPIFGLAVTGVIATDKVKRNNQAQAGDQIILTKPLGIGVLSQAEKKSLLRPEHRSLALDTMCRLNSIGEQLSELDYVSAMTDVTGFGLLGHLTEMCEGSSLFARVNYDAVPVLSGVKDYIEQGCIPGGTKRNFASYGDKISALSPQQQALLCDPQTSGGLLVAVKPSQLTKLDAVLKACNVEYSVIGELSDHATNGHLINVR